MFYYSPETKHQSMEWMAWKFQLTKPGTEMMLINPFEKQVVNHKESVLECKTANTEFYTQVLGRLQKEILGLGPQFQEKGN